MKLFSFFFLFFFSFIYSIDLEIEEDFILNIDYRLEKLESNWNNRGKIIFSQKDKKNYQPSIKIENENKDFDLIQKECELKGNYYIRFSDNSISYYSTINPCDLIKSKYHDKIRINTLSPISKKSIISMNYDTEVLFDIDDSNKKKFISNYEIVDINRAEGPIFNNEEEEVKKKDGKNPENQSFFSKYWWVIMIMMFMLMMGGGDEEGQGQTQGGNK